MSNKIRCVKCDEKLETSIVLNKIEDGFLSMNTRSTIIYWCDNEKCDRFGVLTLAHKINKENK